MSTEDELQMWMFDVKRLFWRPRADDPKQKIRTGHIFPIPVKAAMQADGKPIPDWKRDKLVETGAQVQRAVWESAVSGRTNPGGLPDRKTPSGEEPLVPGRLMIASDKKVMLLSAPHSTCRPLTTPEKAYAVLERGVHGVLNMESDCSTEASGLYQCKPDWNSTPTHSEEDKKELTPSEDDAKAAKKAATLAGGSMMAPGDCSVFPYFPQKLSRRLADEPGDIKDPRASEAVSQRMDRVVTIRKGWGFEEEVDDLVARLSEMGVEMEQPRKQLEEESKDGGDGDESKSGDAAAAGAGAGAAGATADDVNPEVPRPFWSMSCSKPVRTPPSQDEMGVEERGVVKAGAPGKALTLLEGRDLHVNDLVPFKGESFQACVALLIAGARSGEFGILHTHESQSYETLSKMEWFKDMYRWMKSQQNRKQASTMGTSVVSGAQDRKARAVQKIDQIKKMKQIAATKKVARKLAEQQRARSAQKSAATDQTTV